MREFRTERITEQPLPLKRQYVLVGVASPPQTKIYRARDAVRLSDFESFVIEHEHEVAMRGRINDQAFDKFIRMGIMKAYYSDQTRLLLITGKKDDILDFCRTTADLPDITLATIRVDMQALLARLTEVRTVWFRFPSGLIHASALMGAHLEKTQEFAGARAAGDISVLSFYFEAGGEVHPVMVTADGAVVLQDEYTEVADEIDVVLRVRSELLDGICSEEEVRPTRKNTRA